MGLYDDRAAGGQGTGRVPASGGIGQGKITGPEDHHWAQGDHGLSKIVLGPVLTIWRCPIKGVSPPILLGDQGGKGPQLVHGPAPFPDGPSLGKTGFRRLAITKLMDRDQDLDGKCNQKYSKKS